MNCYYHPNLEAVATCVVCGKAICSNCSVNVAGRITCQSCVSSGNVGRLQTQSSRPTNILAIISLILSIMGLCTGIFAIPAWITGYIAEKQILANPNQDGLQMAKAGKIIGMVVTIIYGLLLVCYILLVIVSFIFSLSQQRY